jgi:hypothetical protein
MVIITKQVGIERTSGVISKANTSRDQETWIKDFLTPMLKGTSSRI